MEKKEGWVLEIDRIDYKEAFELQRKIVNARSKDEIKDTFILLEHFPVFTANRKETFNTYWHLKNCLKRKA